MRNKWLRLETALFIAGVTFIAGPRGIGVERLRDASAEWSQQLAKLGLPSDLV